MSQTQELKPCPICNGTAMFKETHRGHWQIQCSNCTLEYGSGQDKEKIQREWNTRPDSDRLRKAAELLIATLDAHEIESLDCDRRGDTYCECLSKQKEELRAALSTPQQEGIDAYQTVKDWAHRLETKFETIIAECDRHADGSPDATELGKFANELIGLSNDISLDAVRTLRRERDELLDAAKLAHSALDKLMGDTDLAEDDSEEMRACQALSSLIERANPLSEREVSK